MRTRWLSSAECHLGHAMAPGVSVGVIVGRAPEKLFSGEGPIRCFSGARHKRQRATQGLTRPPSIAAEEPEGGQLGVTKTRDTSTASPRGVAGLLELIFVASGSVVASALCNFMRMN